MERVEDKLPKKRGRPRKVALEAAGAAAATVEAARAQAVMEATLVETPGIRDERIPDRVCVDKTSPFYWPHYKSLGVKFDGEERLSDVHEYCVSEGWIIVRLRNSDGKYMIDKATGKFLTKRLEGRVEPYLKNLSLLRDYTPADGAKISAAQEKRARKAAKLAERGRL